MRFISILKKQKFRPKRSQNFLTNPFILSKIVKTANIKKEDKVLEIGAGPGNLTQILAKRAGKVFAVEVDRTLLDILKNNLREYSNVSVISADGLKIDLSSFGLRDLDYKLVANIPYNITGKILRKFLSKEPRPKVLVLLLQKEVAKKIVEKPPKANKLSLSVQFYGRPKIISLVKKENFWPRPKVDSALVKISVKKKIPLEAEKHFFSLIQIGFSSSRKYLINNFKQAKIGDEKKILRIFKNLKINPKIRASELSQDKWLKLSRKISL